jgi:release factor glutamine methyltransferase
VRYRHEARDLFCHAAGLAVEDLFRDPAAAVPADRIKEFLHFVRERGDRRPFQYLTGYQGFWSLDIKVNPSVLIPRPETEILVEESLRFLEKREAPRIIDLGTGSGNIALALALERPDAWITALDIDLDALRIASFNASRYHLDSRIRFVCSDLFSALSEQRCRERVHLVVSNPPYISESAYHDLQPEIRCYEPKRALLAGKEGLDYYRLLIPAAGKIVSHRGLLALEIGQGQKDEVAALLASAGWRILSIRRDYAGVIRVIVSEKDSGHG